MQETSACCSAEEEAPFRVQAVEQQRGPRSLLLQEVGLRAEPKRSNPRSTEVLEPAGLRQAKDKRRYNCRIRDRRMKPVGIWVEANNRRNRRASGPRSPTFPLLKTKLRISSVAFPLPQKQHVNPPIPLFKIPPAQWPTVLQRVAQGESLRQIARSYHTSYEAVRRVLQAARQELVRGEGEPSAARAEDAEQ
jgi:hypothetical protein